MICSRSGSAPPCPAAPSGSGPDRVHVLLDGHRIKTVPSRLDRRDIARLTAAGAQPAGPPPHRGCLNRRRSCAGCPSAARSWSADSALPGIMTACPMINCAGSASASEPPSRAHSSWLATKANCWWRPSPARTSARSSSSPLRSGHLLSVALEQILTQLLGRRVWIAARTRQVGEAECGRADDEIRPRVTSSFAAWDDSPERSFGGTG